MDVVDTAEGALRDALSASLARTFDLLKFAEAKNAAALTFSSAWLISVGAFLNSGSGEPAVRICAALALAFFLAAAIVTLRSLYARLSPSEVKASKDRRHNLLYFAHAALGSTDELAYDFRARYVSSSGLNETYNSDLIHQIHVTSIITVLKFRSFNYATLLIVCGIISFVQPMILGTVLPG